MNEARVEEKNAQEEYEQFMADSKEKRAKDSKKSEEKELAATKQFMADLHEDCDWLLENFEARKTARAEEIDALGKAKAVLSGADFSLMQTGSKTMRFLGSRK